MNIRPALPPWSLDRRAIKPTGSVGKCPARPISYPTRTERPVNGSISREPIGLFTNRVVVRPTRVGFAEVGRIACLPVGVAEQFVELGAGLHPVEDIALRTLLAEFRQS